jgi:hypothetical protein
MHIYLTFLFVIMVSDFRLTVSALSCFTSDHFCTLRALLHLRTAKPYSALLYLDRTPEIVHCAFGKNHPHDIAQNRNEAKPPNRGSRARKVAGNSVGKFHLCHKAWGLEEKYDCPDDVDAWNEKKAYGKSGGCSIDTFATARVIASFSIDFECPDK